MNKVSFGWASWIGVVGACAAALAPVFSSLPTTWGAAIAAVLAGITVIGRQLQAITNTQYGSELAVDETQFVMDAPTEPTDVQQAG